MTIPNAYTPNKLGEDEVLMPEPTHVFCTGLGATYVTSNSADLDAVENLGNNTGTLLYALRTDIDEDNGLVLGWKALSDLPENWLETTLAAVECTKVWESFDYRVQVITKSDEPFIINSHDDPVYAMQDAFNLQLLALPVRIAPVRVVPCFDVWQAYYINHPMYATEIPEEEVLWSYDFFQFVGDELVRAGVEQFLGLIAKPFGDGDEIAARISRSVIPGIKLERNVLGTYHFNVETSKSGCGMVPCGPQGPVDDVGFPFDANWPGEPTPVIRALVGALNGSNVCYAKEAMITTKHYPSRENWEYKLFEYSGTGGTHEYIINRAGERVEKLSIPDLLHKMV